MNKLTLVLTWFYHVYQTSERPAGQQEGHIKQWPREVPFGVFSFLVEIVFGNLYVQVRKIALGKEALLCCCASPGGGHEHVSEILEAV